MIKHQLATVVGEGLVAAQAAGALPEFPLPAYTIDRAQKPEWGDFACSLALKLASAARRPPLQIAQAIASHLALPPSVAKVTITPPGFINLALSDTWVADQVDKILSAGSQYPTLDMGRGKRAQVEHVSANPTGPLTVGSGRNAAIGDTLARALAAAGYTVETEYYLNDAGSQIRNFGGSVYARYAQAFGREEPIPQDGYHGAYVAEIARKAIAQEGDRYLHTDRSEAVQKLGQIGVDAMVEDIEQTLLLLNVHFDGWFSEASLYTSGLFDRVFKILEEKGLLYRKEDAVWFKATEFGLSQDAVIIRSPKVIPNPAERPTYLASDVAYAWNKLAERGFDQAVYVWGADHSGDQPRVHAAIRALGLDPGRAPILLYQHVLLKRGGEMVKMSKRTGEFVTLREVVEEVGADAVRFMLITRSMDSTMDFDLDLAKKQSEENPVYYVQYAHARIASILRHAGEVGLSDQGADVSLLTHPAERSLILEMLRLEDIVELVAQKLEPHHLPHYAMELAAAFHVFYKQCRVVSSDPADLAVSRARLRLIHAAQQVLARTLGLMGVNAPESM